MLRPGDAADAGSAERKLDEWAERKDAYRRPARRFSVIPRG